MDELDKRVLQLEEKLLAKDDELLVLRAAIANLTRRLNVCEEHTKACTCGSATAAGAGADRSDSSSSFATTSPNSRQDYGTRTKSTTPMHSPSKGSRPPVTSTGVRASPGASRRQLPVPGQPPPTSGARAHQSGSGPRQTATSLARASSSPALGRKPASSSAVSGKPPVPAAPALSSASGREDKDTSGTGSSGGYRTAQAAVSFSDTAPSPGLKRHGIGRRSAGKSSKGSRHLPSALSANQSTTTNMADSTVRMFLHGKPCVFHAPSDYPLAAVDHPQKAPAEQLELEWVYGYRGRDCRNNLFVLASGEVLYFVAAIGVLLNRTTRTQRHYRHHTDDIKVMALHPNGILVATGQAMGRDKETAKAHIRVWSSETLETLSVISDQGFERGFCSVGFSQRQSGNLLFAVDESNNHQLSIWDWSKPHKLAESRSHGDSILCAAFSPADDRTVVMAGKQQVTFWTLDAGKLCKKSGLFEKHPKPRFVTCMTFTSNHDLVTGDSTGTILIWSAGGNRITQVIKNAHEGSILSLLVLEDGTLLSGGGKDRRIVAWDSGYRPTGDEYELPDTLGAIRMLAEVGDSEEDGGGVAAGDGPVILVGTTHNCIMEGSLSTGFREIIKGHCEELWGLAVHPMQDRFVTAGYDKTVNCWDATNHDVVWSAPVAEEACSVAIHPTGDIVVIGLRTGRWIIFDGSSGTYITSSYDSSEALACTKFSPDGRMLAVGSHDSFVYVYTVDDDMKTVHRFGKCSGHSSTVQHLDWSTDSQYMQTMSADYELLFWKAKTCKQMTSPLAMRDVIWATYSCPLGFPVVGIWPEGADGSDINTVHRNSTSSLLASGDDFSKVKLFRYPMPQPKSLFQEAIGHSSHVTSVQFTHDDTLLISTGGKDMAILQWQVLTPDTII